MNNKKISLADLLVRIKQYKGLLAAWNKRLLSSTTISVENEETYKSQTDYTFAECLAEVVKLKEYLNYLKGIRNNNSQEQILLSYQIGELKDFNTTLEGLRLNKTFTKYTKEGHITVEAYLPTTKKDIDKMVLENQALISSTQSKITHHNNTTFVEVLDY